MKMIRIFTVAISFAFGIAVLATAQTYFEDNFDDPKESEKKWVDLWGTWEFQDDEYHQTQQVPNAMSFVADEFWDDAWNDYTFEVNGMRTAGAEGFLIMFRSQGTMQPRGQALRDHPPRMEKLKPSLEYWWNLGGWGNTRSGVERWIDGVRIEQGFVEGHSIDLNEWYDIKIVNTPTDYTVILNDEELANVKDNTEDGVGRIGLATWSTAARYDNVLVYGPDGPSQPVDRSGKITTTWGNIKFQIK